MGKSFAAVSVIYVAIVLIVAAIFNIWETKFTMIDSVWWAFTTATTTGYGDVYPVTLIGRSAAIFLMHFGPGFAFPVMTGLIVMKLIVDSDAFTHEEQEKMMADNAETKAMVAEIKAMLQEQKDFRITFGIDVPADPKPPADGPKHRRMRTSFPGKPDK